MSTYNYPPPRPATAPQLFTQEGAEGLMAPSYGGVAERVQQDKSSQQPPPAMDQSSLPSGPLPESVDGEIEGLPVLPQEAPGSIEEHEIEEVKKAMAEYKAAGDDLRGDWGYECRAWRVDDNATLGKGEKKIILIRHGEGNHILARRIWRKYGRSGEPYTLENDPKYQFQDPALTETGVKQSLALIPRLFNIDPEPQLVLLSPMRCTISTAVISCAPWWPKVVMDIIRERHGIHTCDKRFSKSKLQELYPNIEYAYIYDDDDDWEDDYREERHLVTMRAARFIEYLRYRKESRLVVISHSEFLLSMLNAVLTIDDPAQRSYFGTAEMRTYVFSWKDAPITFMPSKDDPPQEQDDESIDSNSDIAPELYLDFFRDNYLQQVPKQEATPPPNSVTSPALNTFDILFPVYESQTTSNTQETPTERTGSPAHISAPSSLPQPSDYTASAPPTPNTALKQQQNSVQEFTTSPAAFRTSSLPPRSQYNGSAPPTPNSTMSQQAVPLNRTVPPAAVHASSLPPRSQYNGSAPPTPNSTMSQQAVPLNRTVPPAAVHASSLPPRSQYNGSAPPTPNSTMSQQAVPLNRTVPPAAVHASSLPPRSQYNGSAPPTPNSTMSQQAVPLNRTVPPAAVHASSLPPRSPYTGSAPPTPNSTVSQQRGPVKRTMPPSALNASSLPPRSSYTAPPTPNSAGSQQRLPLKNTTPRASSLPPRSPYTGSAPTTPNSTRSQQRVPLRITPPPTSVSTSALPPRSPYTSSAPPTPNSTMTQQRVPNRRTAPPGNLSTTSGPPRPAYSSSVPSTPNSSSAPNTYRREGGVPPTHPQPPAATQDFFDAA